MTPELPTIPETASTVQVVLFAAGWLLTVAIPAGLAIWQRIKENRTKNLMREALNAAHIGHGAIEIAHQYAIATGNVEGAKAIEGVKDRYAEIMQRAAPRVDVLDALIRDAKAEVAAIFSPPKDAATLDPATLPLDAVDDEFANAVIASAERRAALLEGRRPVPVRSKLYASTGRVRPSSE